MPGNRAAAPRGAVLAALFSALCAGTPGPAAGSVAVSGRGSPPLSLPFTPVAKPLGDSLWTLLSYQEHLLRAGLGGDLIRRYPSLLHYRRLDPSRELDRRALGAIAQGLSAGYETRLARALSPEGSAEAPDPSIDQEFSLAYEAAVPGVEAAARAEAMRIVELAGLGAAPEELEAAASAMRRLALFGPRVEVHIERVERVARGARAGRTLASADKQALSLQLREPGELAREEPHKAPAPDLRDAPAGAGRQAPASSLGRASDRALARLAYAIERAAEARTPSLILVPAGTDLELLRRMLPRSLALAAREGRLAIHVPGSAADAARKAALRRGWVLDFTYIESASHAVVPSPEKLPSPPTGGEAVGGVSPSGAWSRALQALERLAGTARREGGAPLPSAAAAFAVFLLGLLGLRPRKSRSSPPARRTAPAVERVDDLPVESPDPCGSCGASCGGGCSRAPAPARPAETIIPLSALRPARAASQAKPVDLAAGRVEGLPGFGDPVALPKGAPVRVAVEVGSTTAKTVVLDEQGNIVHGTYQKHHARVYEMAATLLEGVLERFKDQEIVNVGFSGSAGQRVSEKLSEFVDRALEARHGAEGKKGQVQIRYTNEVISQTAPIWETYGHLGKDIHIIEIGGEDSKFIHIGSDGRLKKTALNGECAAGTGTFLEEQVPRLGFDNLLAMIEGAWQVVGQEPPKIAGRCTVFAKTDITHLLRHENVPKELVAWGVTNTVGLTFLMNLVGEVKRGMAGDGIIVFQGGTSKNRVLVEAFRRLVAKSGLDPSRLVVPEFPEVRIAQGAAVFAARDLPEEARIDREALVAGLASLKDFVTNRRVTSSLPALALRDPERMLKSWKPHQFLPGERRDVYLGLDVGSTTTKFVLIDAKTEALLYKDYVRTEGRPFEIMEQGVRRIRDLMGEHVNILHVGVTGSGREAMGAMVGADVVVDEINAHATAVGRLHPEADTIFEIGGQDSKYMRVMKGMVEDFEMNKACAAGTGSFFDEAAQRVLGVLVEDLGDMALRALSPADLGEVCTVFMKSRIVQAQAEGYTPDDIAAGLAYSIARNYLNKVKGAKPVGNAVVFQGGVSNNKAVVAAFEQLTGRPVTVPEHAEVMGAIGMALIAKTRYENKAEALVAQAASQVGTKFRGLSARLVPKEVVEGPNCGACANRCKLMYIKTEEGEKLVYGAGCDIHDKSIPKEKRKLAENIPDLLERRYELLTKAYPRAPQAPEPHGGGLKAWFREAWSRAFRPDAAAGGVVAPSGRVVGFPAGLNFWENFPFWNAFFTASGLEVTVSKRSSKEVLELAKRYINIDPCLPMKIVYGMVAELLEKEGVTDVFLPAVMELKPLDPRSKNSMPCPQVTGTPHALKGVFRPEEHGKRFLTPELNLRAPREDILEQFTAFGAELGLSPATVRQAYAAAEEASEGFRRAQREEGAKVLAEIKARGKKAVVLLGRPYNALDGGMNLGIDREGRKRGWQVLPLDFLPLESVSRHPSDLNNDTWYFQGKLLQAAEAIAQDPDLYPVYITNFRCGPDAFILKQVEARMRQAGKPLLVLELDEHTSIAGYKTRLDAFITSIELAQEAARKVEEKAETVSALSCAPPPSTRPLSFVTLEELKGKKVFVPRMSDHSILLAGAMRAEGVEAVAFRPPTDAALEQGRRHSNGKECLPYPLVVGESIVGLEEAVKAGTRPEDMVVMFMKTNGSCRFSQYSQALERSLQTAGFEGTMVANIAGGSAEPKVHNHFTPTLKLAANIWKAYLVGDYMHQMLLENRPYEIHTEESAGRKAEILAGGRAVLGDFIDRINPADPDLLRKVKLSDLVYERALREAAQAMGEHKRLVAVLERFVRDIRGVPQDRTRTKPLVGVAGEIYVRWNDYANGDILRQLEAQGAEAFLAPVGEFIYNGLEPESPLKALGLKQLLRLKGIKELLGYFIGRGFLRWHDDRLFRVFARGLERPEFGRARNVTEVIRHGRKHTGGFSAGEGPLTLGAIEEFALHGADGAVMIGPMGCMPNTIYEALIGKLKDGLPEGLREFPILVISMSESRNLKNVRTRTEALVHQTKEYKSQRETQAPAAP